MNLKKFKNILLVVALLFILLPLSGCNKLNVVNVKYVYDDTGYGHGNMSFKEPVEEINIDWINGDVDIIRTNNVNEVIVQEDVDVNIENEYRVHHNLKNKVLDVKYSSSFENLNYKFAIKRLRVIIPDVIKTVNLNLISADLKVNGINIDSLKINNVSGDITINNSILNNLNIDTTSGEIIVFNNTINNNTIKTASGNMGLSYNELPKNINVESVSSSVRLYVSLNDSFTINYDKVSGKFKTKLPFQTIDGLYVFNNGSNPFMFKTVSGSCYVFSK